MPLNLLYTAAVCTIGYMESAIPISQCGHAAAKLVCTYVCNQRSSLSKNVTFMGVSMMITVINALFAQLRLAKMPHSFLVSTIQADYVC